ncbi:MAG: DUF1576 domain-containing protein [Oscillospiraceae bacterium]|nr:DUF1576 domain-containing protein [Oscillospiraceae bacterium]
MTNEIKTKYRIPVDYYVLIFICGLFVFFAFANSSPADIIRGFWIINTSRSVLVSDYIAMSGLSATLVNSAVSCLLFLSMLIVTKTPPSGKIISALFLTLGFAMFGKNVINTIPIVAGVALYAKANKEKFSKYLGHSMFGATVSPIVSEIAFSDGNTSVAEFLIAYAVGMFIGFIFPVVADAVKKMHHGFCLYNSGIAGGFIATFAVGIFRSMGLDIVPETYWSTEYTTQLAVGAYSFSVSAILFALILSGPRQAIVRFLQIVKERDRDNNDYLTYYGSTCYINIGIMCIIATTVMLILGIPINGPVLGGIITIAGFSVAGKHLRNTIPVLLGSVIAANLNYLNVATAPNALSILFSTGLAPISCKFGFVWGIIAGFMHVSVAIFIGNLNGGLNLYNNGFAGGFVAITLVPLIVLFNKLVRKEESNL